MPDFVFWVSNDSILYSFDVFNSWGLLVPCSDYHAELRAYDGRENVPDLQEKVQSAELCRYRFL